MHIEDKGEIQMMRNIMSTTDKVGTFNTVQYKPMEDTKLIIHYLLAYIYKHPDANI